MNRNENGKLSEFFTAEGERLERYLRRKVQSIQRMDAEDIVVDVMLSLFQKSDLAGGAENLAAYVYRSLQNKIVDHLRKKRDGPSLQSFADADETIPLLDLLCVDAQSVSGEAERREFLRRLRAAVDSLEPRQRAVFLATELHGIPFRTRAEQWHEPIGTLLSRKCGLSRRRGRCSATTQSNKGAIKHIV